MESNKDFFRGSHEETTDPNKKRSLATPRGAMAIGSMEVLGHWGCHIMGSSVFLAAFLWEHPRPMGPKTRYKDRVK